MPQDRRRGEDRMANDLSGMAEIQGVRPDGAFERKPLLPPAERWDEIHEMLCGHCHLQPGCEIVKQMLRFAHGRAPWPADAWVSDPGAGITCLSYVSKPKPKVAPELLETLANMSEEELPPTCGGCAARKGSEASVSLHTQRDYRAAVRDGSGFNCHEDPNDKAMCGGWCRAVLRKLKD